MKQPTKAHIFAMTRNPLGNAEIVIKCGRSIDYVWGLFKGRECTRMDDAHFEDWFKEGETIAFEDQNLVLVMGIPITEIRGEEAKKMIAAEKAKETATNLP